MVDGVFILISTLSGVIMGAFIALLPEFLRARKSAVKEAEQKDVQGVKTVETVKGMTEDEKQSRDTEQMKLFINWMFGGAEN